MVHILLLILKIIGIILLVILCLALLLLFSPITYIGNIEIKDKLVYGKLRAGWLFHIVQFGLKFKQSDASYALRVLGIPVVSSKKNENKDSKEEKNIVINVIKNKKNTSETETANIQNSTRSEKVQVQENATNTETERNNFENATNTDTEKERNNSGKATNTETDSETASKKNFIEKIKEFFKKIKTKISDILKNIKEYCNKAKEIKEFLTANTTKEAYNYGKKIIIKLIKHILPKKIRGHVQFGFEEPHLTGQTLGYIAMGFSMFHINPKHIVIEPDFEKKILVGNVKFKGRIVLGVVGLYILKLYFKKEINDIIKKFK